MRRQAGERVVKWLVDTLLSCADLPELVVEMAAGPPLKCPTCRRTLMVSELACGDLGIDGCGDWPGDCGREAVRHVCIFCGQDGFRPCLKSDCRRWVCAACAPMRIEKSGKVRLLCHFH